MLTGPLREEIQKVLNQLDDSDLGNLAGTVTRGLLKNKIESRQEALDAILLYSNDEVSILRRKILTREVLFSYLSSKGIPVHLPATKNDLINAILTSWNSHSTILEVSDNVVTSDQIHYLCEQFVTWFYSEINKEECINHDHFFPDASLTINTMTGDSNLINSDMIENDPQAVAYKLYATKIEHGLYFNPNSTSEGVQGVIDPHGLVLILVCGTLHSTQDSGTCVGIFEQKFGLARDPFSDNNWKIKTCELNLKSVDTKAICY